jgi:hypothetical protein
MLSFVGGSKINFILIDRYVDYDVACQEETSYKKNKKMFMGMIKNIKVLSRYNFRASSNSSARLTLVAQNFSYPIKSLNEFISLSDIF